MNDKEKVKNELRIMINSKIFNGSDSKFEPLRI